MPTSTWLLLAIPLTAKGAELPEIAFSVKPRLCVLTDAEEVCYDNLEVQWQSATPMNICLHRNGFEKPLTCWERATEGHYQFALATSENVTFSLKARETGLEVSEAFEVIHGQKPLRRQRRNPWSFF